MIFRELLLYVAVLIIIDINLFLIRHIDVDFIDVLFCEALH